jgi:TolB protein
VPHFRFSRLSIVTLTLLMLAVHPAGVLASDPDPNRDDDTAASTEIAYISQATGVYQLMLFDLETGQARQLYATGISQYAPEWSPDGTMLAFSTAWEGDDAIVVLDLASGQVTPITTMPGTEWAASWSPDGTLLAYHGFDSGDSEIYIYDLATATATVITENDADNYTPAWSPDGREIVYFSNTNNDTMDGDLFIYTIETGQTRQLNPVANGRYGLNPAWSPDGKQIAFPYEDGTTDRHAIAALPPEGGAPIVLFDQLGQDSNPAWSPDGGQIAFVGNPSGNSDIFIVNVDGSNLRQITTDTAEDIAPAWRPIGE